MKNYIGIILIVFLLSFSSVSCDDLFGLLNFDSNEYKIEFVISPVDQVGYHIFCEEVFESNLDSILSANDVSEDQLKEVNIKEAIALITDPDTTVFFDPLASFSISVYTDSLGEKIIASQDTIPDGVREITLNLAGDDLKNYMFETDFMLSAMGVLSEQTFKPIPVQVKVKFEVKAGLN
jgi:hypothetical protein